MNKKTIGYRQLTILLLTAGVLLLFSCQSKEETFTTYMDDIESDIRRIVKDTERAEMVVSGFRKADIIMSRYKPEYQKLIATKKKLDYSYTHNAEEYIDYFDASDTINNEIWAELLEISLLIRPHLTEKEWKKLANPNYYTIFINYMAEGA